MITIIIITPPPHQAGSSDKAYAPFAQMVREVLSSNLELAKQLRAQVEANSKGSADDPASAMENAFEGLEMSPSLAKALDELQHGCVYKGEDVQVCLVCFVHHPFFFVMINHCCSSSPFTHPQNQAFYLDNTFNGIKQAEADAQVPAVCKKRIRIDPLAAIVSLLFLGAFGFYVAWRVIFTLPGLGAYLPYGIAVLAIECLGAMSLVPYALTIMWYTVKEEPASTTTLHYHVCFSWGWSVGDVEELFVWECPCHVHPMPHTNYIPHARHNSTHPIIPPPNTTGACAHPLLW